MKMKMGRSKSKGWKKIPNAIYRIVHWKDFQDKIRELRIKYDIPVDGFRAKSYYDIYQVGTSYNHPKWLHSEDARDAWLNRTDSIRDEICSLLKKFNIYYYGYIEIVVPFLFFGNINLKQFRQLIEFHDSNMDVLDHFGMDFIVHQARATGEFEHSTTLSEEERKLLLAENDFALELAKQYPIAIGISRYASLSDTIDYIKKNWSGIKRLLWSGVKPDEGIVPARTSFTLDRNRYIYENQHISPRSELAEMSNRKFGGEIDAIYVRNIISRENKARVKKT